MKKLISFNILLLILISNSLLAQTILPGTTVRLAAGKFGWSGVTESPVFRPKMFPLAKSKMYELKYTVQFQEDFEWKLGGKLPGLSGGTSTTGCNKIDPYGWSVRLMWREHGKVSLYLYDQKRNDFCGKDIALNYQFEAAKEHTINLKVKINDPGVSNGAVNVQVDNIHLLTLKNVELRGNIGKEDALIDTFMFSVFYGGQGPQWAPTRDTEIIFGPFHLK